MVTANNDAPYGFGLLRSPTGGPDPIIHGGLDSDMEVVEVSNTDNVREAIAVALAEHRYRHVPEGGHAVCECGWAGPYTIATHGVTDHVADAVLAVLADRNDNAIGRLTDALVALDRGYDDDSGFDIEEALDASGLTLVERS